MAVLRLTEFRLAWARRWRKAVLLSALLGVVAPGAAPTISPEYQLKAVFLFNFAQFVEWPAAAFRSPSAALVIGVVGDDPFGSYLDELVKGEKVASHPLQVRHYKRSDEIADCHLIFIARSEAANLERILGALKGRSFLTVSDIDTFTRQGGMVRFVMENGKIRLRINVAAAQACELTISSKILRAGTIAIPGKD